MASTNKIAMIVEMILLVFLLWKLNILSPLFLLIMEGCEPMQILVNFSVLFIFILWLQYEIRKNNRLTKKKSELFWERERQANLTRKADISELEYIEIPLERLPMADHADPTINSYRDTIRNLSSKKIVNLTGFTNTDLKLKYGAANITLLSEYDNHYTVLVSILQKWGERLYHHGNTMDAVSVLEFAIMCLTDVRKSYLLLAQIYANQHTPEKIDDLLEILPFTKVLRKDALAEELRKIKNS